MPKWGRNDQAVTVNATAYVTNGAPLGTWALVNGGGGANAHHANTLGKRANTDAAMFSNVTPGSFQTGVAVGIFGVSATEQANNTTNKVADQPAHAGWTVRRAGTGPVVGATTTGTGGASFATGETITISNGASNATLRVTANATLNIGSLTVTTGGAGWTNAAIAVVTYNRETHVVGVGIPSGANGSAAAVGYNNTDILVISNGTVNAIARMGALLNANGGINNSTFTIANSEVGCFPTGWANAAANLVFTITNSTFGTATGNATTTSFTANLATSTGSPTVTLTLGGRAGRVHHEVLVAMGSLGAQTAAYGTPATANDAAGDDTFFAGT